MDDTTKYAPVGEAEARAERAKLDAEAWQRREAYEAEVRARGPLTVNALIEKLQQFPEDAIVDIEGCDCTGEACDVVNADPLYTNKDAAFVLITRI